MSSFHEKVKNIVKNIPSGETMTYKQVASFAGSPGAARAVGSMMAKNTDINIPCHRVIRSDGNIGKYNSLRGNSKSELLEQEKNR